MALQLYLIFKLISKFSGQRLSLLLVLYPLKYLSPPWKPFHLQLRKKLDTDRSRQAGSDGVQSVIFPPELQVITFLGFQLVLKYLVTSFHTKFFGDQGSSEVLRRCWSVGSKSLHHRESLWLSREYHCFFPSRYHRQQWTMILILFFVGSPSFS